MELQDVIDTIKIQLFGDLLESEIKDKTFEKIVNMSLKELNRYYNVTKLLEVDGSSCIDLSKNPEIDTIVNVYRTHGVGNASSDSGSTSDPVLMSQLQMFNFGNYAYTNDWPRRYAQYNLLQQISNTISTDLEFKEDKSAKKLYVNLPQGTPSKLTIEYIPKLNDTSEIISDYWNDILLRLALAHSKVALGRIRTRFTQDNAIWKGDGETILAEGNTELTELRERLRTSTDYTLPID